MAHDRPRGRRYANISTRSPIPLYLFPSACLSISAAGTARAQGPFVLAGPSVNTVIIKGAVQPAYQYPYWGSDQILRRFLELITGIKVPVITDTVAAGQDLDALYDFRIWIMDQPRIQTIMGGDLAALDDDIDADLAGADQVDVDARFR